MVKALLVVMQGGSGGEESRGTRYLLAIQKWTHRLAFFVLAVQG